MNQFIIERNLFWVKASRTEIYLVLYVFAPIDIISNYDPVTSLSLSYSSLPEPSEDILTDRLVSGGDNHWLMAPPPRPHVYFIEDEEIYDISSMKAAGDAIPAEPVWKPKREEWLIVGCLSLVSLVVSLDATILVIALPVWPFTILCRHIC
jgi:hypothetical protein